jgi:NAD(P)-dependent dehydrogenase (short-subunit alcohol dehydrogenase family)
MYVSMQTVFVTGSNRGIGLEFVRQYAVAGARVIATCRHPEGATDLQALANVSAHNVVVERLDVTDSYSIAALAQKYTGEPIDILINNAGAPGPRGPNNEKLGDQKFGSLNYEAWLDLMNVNTLGPVRVAEAFVENVALGREKKIVTLSSTMGSIQEMPYPIFLYSTSKTALNKAISILAIALKDRGIIAAIFCPGHVKTDLGGEGATVEVEDSVAGLRELFSGLTKDDAGTYTRYNGVTVAW